MRQSGPDDSVKQAMPIVIAPFTYFGNLLEETGDTTSTPESIFRFAMQHADHKVTITRNLATLSANGNAATESVHVSDPDHVNFVIDGSPVTDLDRHEGELLDYCSECVRETDCSRFEVLSTPVAISRREGNKATAYYKCPRGHSWTCNWAVADRT